MPFTLVQILVSWNIFGSDPRKLDVLMQVLFYIIYVLPRFHVLMFGAML